MVESVGLGWVRDEGRGKEDEGCVGKDAGGVEDHAGEQVVIFDAECFQVVLHPVIPQSA